MIHLEEKHKKREQAKFGEDFETIKERLSEILEDYQESDDDEMDITKLADPDFFMSKETKEKNLAQSEINKLLDKYLEVCHDREDILSNVYDSLNFEEIVRNLKSPITDDLDNVSSEISMTIDMIHQSSSKLSKFYKRLLELCKERPSNSEVQSAAQIQLRRLNQQKQVINKFKTMRAEGTMRKEKVDPWKYAANEIVDLVNSARSEGADGLEKIEKEFEKLMATLNQQTRLFQEQQDTISKLKTNLKKYEEMKEKLTDENIHLQSEHDRTRTLVRSVQMKCAKLEFELKVSNEKANELQNTIAETSLDINNKSSAGTLQSKPEQSQENLKNEIDRLDDLLKAEQQTNKELMIEKQRLARLCNATSSNLRMSAIKKASVLETSKPGLSPSVEITVVNSAISSSLPQPTRHKCIKCSSYKARLDELTKDMEAKREQIVQLSNHLEEQQKINISSMMKDMEAKQRQIVQLSNHLEEQQSMKTDMEAKREQIVQLSNHLEEQQKINISSMMKDMEAKQKQIVQLSGHLEEQQSMKTDIEPKKEQIVQQSDHLEEQQKINISSMMKDMEVKREQILQQSNHLEEHQKINISSTMKDMEVKREQILQQSDHLEEQQKINISSTMKDMEAKQKQIVQLSGHLEEQQKINISSMMKDMEVKREQILQQSDHLEEQQKINISSTMKDMEAKQKQIVQLSGHLEEQQTMKTDIEPKKEQIVQQSDHLEEQQKINISSMMKDMEVKREQILQQSNHLEEHQKINITSMMKDMDAKREQIVQLSNHLEEQQKINISSKKESLKEIASRYLNRDKPIPPNPSPSLTNASMSSNDATEKQISSRSGQRSSVICSSTQQSFLFHQVTVKNVEIAASPTVLDQFTQTDFPVDIPVIMKQRASVPTQNMISKNFSSLVDEEFKDMASRIYNYVNTIGEEVENSEEVPEKSSKDNLLENKSSGDQLTPSSSTASNITNVNHEQNLPSASNYESRKNQKDDFSTITLGEQSAKGNIQVLNNDGNQESFQPTSSRATNIKQPGTDADNTKRRGNESGFFDESTPKAPGSSEKSNTASSKWTSARSGVINHILRFIKKNSKCSCSFLEKSILEFETGTQHKTDEDIIKSELNVYAGHALDILNVISYSVKQMNESRRVPLSYYNFPVLTKFGGNWNPPRISNQNSSRNVTFPDSASAADRKDALLFPKIVTQAVLPSLKIKQQNKTGFASNEVKVKVAENKRDKILDRHKKLVTKLRQSRVGSKEIYKILGIQPV